MAGPDVATPSFNGAAAHPFELNMSGDCEPVDLLTSGPMDSRPDEGAVARGPSARWDPNIHVVSPEAAASAAATAQMYEEKMQEMQAQIADLWSQKEAFRRANERITRLLMQLQNQEPQAAADLNAAAADALRSARGASTHRASQESSAPHRGKSHAGLLQREGSHSGRRASSCHRGNLTERSFFQSRDNPSQSPAEVRGGRTSGPSSKTMAIPRLNLDGALPKKTEGGKRNTGRQGRPEGTKGPQEGEPENARREMTGDGGHSALGEHQPGGNDVEGLRRSGTQLHVPNLEGSRKKKDLPPLPLHNLHKPAAPKRDPQAPARQRSMSQSARGSRVSARENNSPRRTGGAGCPAVPPVSVGRRRTVQLSDGLASARSRIGGGSYTARLSLAETALRTPRRCFLDDGIACAPAATTQRAPTLAGGPASSQSSLAAGAAAQTLSTRSWAAPGGAPGGGAAALGGLEEHLAVSLRQALETLHTVEGSSRAGPADASRGAAAAAVAAAGATGGAMSCVQKPSDGYWHIMYTCVIKIRGTDFFLDVRCGDEGPMSGKLIASKERAGVFKVCVRHLLKSARDFYDSMKVLWWQPLPVVFFEGLLPVDERLRRDAEKELAKRKKNKKKNRKRKAKNTGGQPAAETPSAPPDLLSNDLNSHTGQQSCHGPTAGEKDLAEARAALGSVPSSRACSSAELLPGPCSSGSEAGSGATSRRGNADYCDWDAVSLMYIGSLDADTPVAQFKGLSAGSAGNASPKSGEECWYVSNSNAALPVCRTCRGSSSRECGASETTDRNAGEGGGHAPGCNSSSDDSDEDGRLRISPKGSLVSSDFSATMAGAFDRTCQLRLNNKLTTHELFIVRRTDREHGCFPLYHKNARRYLYAHPTNGLVGMIHASNTPTAAFAQKAVTEALMKKPASAANNDFGVTADLETYPLLASGEGASAVGSKTLTEGRVLPPSEFELVALSDLMVQQTVAQILAALPPAQSPYGSREYLDSLSMDDEDDEEDEIEKNLVEDGSRPTTVSSDDDERRNSASSLPYSGEDDRHDLLSAASSVDLPHAVSTETLLAGHARGTGEAFLGSSLRDGGDLSDDDAEGRFSREKGLHIWAVALSHVNARAQKGGSRRRSEATSESSHVWNSRRSTNPGANIDDPSSFQKRGAAGVCHQFVLSELDADTDLEEETAADRAVSGCAE
ncbi:hypothetical protein BESB_065490 [Besnoitia besnoiti]|uniref:Uncharacterized protein n=1 Tax=Besnoitia besnoiti TaxID=94643 RepID=A0A2A9MFZ3_BESBE|nr:hypothetical protein BESB_065490 [Besnoitia besnoiti]PFH34517.1 hypothetical protein BESB_065490 [Besnoitia besnoiti]